MTTFFFYPKCQQIDIWNKNSKMLLSLTREKSDFEIKIANKCFPLFVKKVNFGVNMTKYQALVRSVNFFENIIFWVRSVNLFENMIF